MTSLIMPRSILTEKLSRRGYHLTREYGVDPLEIVSIAEVMREVGPHDRAPESALLPDVYTYSDETSRAAVEKMATSGMTSLLVVDRDTKKVCGRVGLQDLLLGRRKLVQRERQRKRVFELLTRARDKSTSNIRA
jgi:CBS-domain-containing membrane protein